MPTALTPFRARYPLISTRLHAWTDYIIPTGIAALSLVRSLRPFRGLTTAGPLYHLGYTLFTRHEGGLVPVIPMRTHLAFDAVGALTFIGAGTLRRSQPRWQRLLFIAIGVAELAEIALSSDEDTRPRWRA